MYLYYYNYNYTKRNMETDENIAVCLKFDSFMYKYFLKNRDEKSKSITNIISQITKMMDEKQFIDTKIIEKYNALVITNNMFDFIVQWKDSPNMYLRKRYSHIMQGRTIHYYKKNSTDKEFVDIIKKTLENFNILGDILTK